MYGEEKDPYIHELFCQYNFIGKLKIFSESKIKEINLQIIQTLSSLINKISNITVVYYLLSNNFVNNIISHNYYIKHDNNYLLFYVKFLKILALKLNQTTLQFLFREDINSFPLLENALKLYNHPDNIISNEIKNIFLIILKIDYKPLFQYICNLPIISYFCFLACNIKDKIINLSKKIQEIKKSKQYKDDYKIILDDIINSLIFIQKIFDINCLKINYIIINCMFYYCIIPYIINILSLYKTQKIQNNNNKKIYKIKKSVSLFFINLILLYIKNETFLNILFTLIFIPLKTNSINKYMINTPIQPNNYFYDWNLSIKKTSSTFFNYIQFNLNNSFLNTFLYINNNKYLQAQQIYMKYQNKLSNEPNLNFEKNKEQLLTDLIKDILNKLSCSEISIMTSYHNYLSIGTGINCGLSTKSSNLCVIQKMSKFYIKYFNRNNDENKKKLIKNNIKNNLFELLLNKKEKENGNDKNVLLINILLRNILYKNKNISRLLLKESNIIPGDLLKDEDISYIINLNREKTLINKNENDLTFKKKNIYNNNSYSINIVDSYLNENAKSKIYIKNDISTSNNNILNSNINKYENKENHNHINTQYFETDIFKNVKVSNLLISISEVINNSNNTIIEKSKKSLKNIDNNGDENETINNKEKNGDFLIQNKSIEVKNLPKNNLSFDNDFFKNFENINFYENNKMIYENYYNEELVGILIKLLDIKSNIKIITFKIIIDNILSMITYKKYNNYINNNTINQGFISQNNKNAIYLIYEKYRNDILNNYNNKKSFHNNAYKMFIKQYDKYILLNNIDNDDMIKEGYILLFNDLQILEKNNINNIFLEIEKKENNYEKNIILFLLIHDFYYKIISYENISNNKNEEDKSKNCLFINNFPLLKRKGLELNKKYFIIDLDSNIKYFNSKCKIIKDKNIDDKEFFYCYLLLYDNFLYIGDSSNNISYTIIKYKFLISSCSIVSDNYNNKNIILYISNGMNSQSNIEIFLDFKDYNTSKGIKSLIEQEIKNAFLFEKGKIKKFIEHLQ